MPLRRDAEVDDERSSRRTGLIWAAVVVALLLVIGVGAYAIVFLGKDDNAVKKTDVPSVVGQAPAAAEQSLKQAGFVAQAAAPDTNGPCDDNQTVPEGRVCTLVAARRRERQGRLDRHLPRLQAEDRAGALRRGQVLRRGGRARCTTHQLTPVKKAVNSAQAEGHGPQAGPARVHDVAPGAKVTLEVSTGKLKLPDVRNMDFGDATRTLNQAGFPNTVDPAPTQRTTDPTKDNKVASESPTPGVAYDPNQKITLTRYVYKAAATDVHHAAEVALGRRSPPATRVRRRRARVPVALPPACSSPSPGSS